MFRRLLFGINETSQFSKKNGTFFSYNKWKAKWAFADGWGLGLACFKCLLLRPGVWKPKTGGNRRRYRDTILVETYLLGLMRKKCRAYTVDEVPNGPKNGPKNGHCMSLLLCRILASWKHHQSVAGIRVFSSASRWSGLCCTSHDHSNELISKRNNSFNYSKLYLMIMYICFHLFDPFSSPWILRYKPRPFSFLDAALAWPTLRCKRVGSHLIDSKHMPDEECWWPRETQLGFAPSLGYGWPREAAPILGFQRLTIPGLSFEGDTQKGLMSVKYRISCLQMFRSKKMEKQTPTHSADSWMNFSQEITMQ